MRTPHNSLRLYCSIVLIERRATKSETPK